MCICFSWRDRVGKVVLSASLSITLPVHDDRLRNQITQSIFTCRNYKTGRKISSTTKKPSWSIKVSVAAQKFATSCITDCKGSDTTWELRMRKKPTHPKFNRWSLPMTCSSWTWAWTFVFVSSSRLQAIPLFEAYRARDLHFRHDPNCRGTPLQIWICAVTRTWTLVACV